MLSRSELDSKFGQILAGDPNAVSNPYPIYNMMREQSEVYWYLDKTPIVTTFAGCREVSLRGDAFYTHRGLDRFNVNELSADHVRMAEEIIRFELLQLSGMNGDTHKRMRSILQRGFGASQVSDMEGFIADVANDMADDMVRAGGTSDLMDLAYRLPLLVVMKMLGVPIDNSEDMAKIKDWSDAIAKVKQFVGATLPPQAVVDAHRAIMSLRDYVDQMAESLRDSPDKTHLMGMLLDAEDADRLSTDELSATFVMISYAGHETTTNLIGNGFLELLRNRSEWNKLCADPSLAGKVPEEVMRYNPPVQMLPRRSAVEQELCGATIPAGVTLMMLYGAADRDPTVFENPEQFVIDRAETKHLGMGFGPHNCLGAGFARLEGRKVFEIFSQRFPDMELAVPPETLKWHPHATFHGMESLPVTLGRDRGRT